MIRYKDRKGMGLTTLLEQQYFPLQSRVADEKTRVHYRRAVRRLGEMLGRPPLVTDLTDDNVAGLMRWEQMRRGVSAETANHSRKCLVALWRWCRDKEIVRGGPTVAKLKTPKRRPKAMTEEELQRLVAAACRTPGQIGGLPARTWWLTLLQIEMDAGIRAGELLALRWEWLDWESGYIHVPAEVRKGKSEDASYWFPPETRQWLAALRRPHGLILGFERHVSRYYQLWDDLLEVAGLPPGRRQKTHALRRTFATALKKEGGDVAEALGHADEATARRYYLDPTASSSRHAELIPDRMRPLSIARIVYAG